MKCLNASSVPEAYRYDPAKDRWSTVSTEGLPLGVFRNGTALAWDGQTTIYALAGARYADTDRREVWQYDIRSEKWARLPDTPYDQGAGNAITWSGYDEQIYAFVGSSHSNHNQGRSYFVRYDPHEATWTTLPLDWAATDDGASLAWAGEYIYALRGEVDEIDSSKNRGFARFHIPTQTWETLPDIPDLGGVGDGGSLLWIGGACEEFADYVFALGGGAADETPGNGFYVYSISERTWSFLDALPCSVGFYVGSRLAFASGYIYYWQGERKAQPCGGAGFYRLGGEGKDRTACLACLERINTISSTACDSCPGFGSALCNRLVSNQPFLIDGSCTLGKIKAALEKMYMWGPARAEAFLRCVCPELWK